MTSGEVARPTRPKSALKARKVVFLELLKEQVNTAEDVMYTPKYIILLQPMGISKRYNSVPVKGGCTLFAPTPYFRARTIRWHHLNFSPADPCCHDNEFCHKIDYNSAPVKDNCALFAPTPLNAAARLYSVAMGQIPRFAERISSLLYKTYKIGTTLIISTFRFCLFLGGLYWWRTFQFSLIVICTLYVCGVQGTKREATEDYVLRLNYGAFFSCDGRLEASFCYAHTVRT